MAAVPPPPPRLTEPKHTGYYGIPGSASTQVIFFYFFILPIILLLLYLLQRCCSKLITSCDKDEVGEDKQEDTTEFFWMEMDKEAGRHNVEDDFVKSNILQHAPILSKLPADYTYPIQVKPDDGGESQFDQVCGNYSDTSLVSMHAVCQWLRCLFHYTCCRWEERRRRPGRVRVKNMKKGRSSSGKANQHGHSLHKLSMGAGHAETSFSEQSYLSTAAAVQRFFPSENMSSISEEDFSGEDVSSKPNKSPAHSVKQCR